MSTTIVLKDKRSYGFEFGSFGCLLQNARDIITKMRCYFITKCNKSLSQNALGILLQNTTFIAR